MQRDHDGRVFASLGFVHGRGECERELRRVRQNRSRSPGRRNAAVRCAPVVDRDHAADVAVEDLALVVVMGLKHLVADAERPAKSLSLGLPAPRVECVLESRVQGCERPGPSGSSAPAT